MFYKNVLVSSVADGTRIEPVNKMQQNIAKKSWNKSKELIVEHKFLGLKPFEISIVMKKLMS